jgi:hypothetical protein
MIIGDSGVDLSHGASEFETANFFCFSTPVGVLCIHECGIGNQVIRVSTNIERLLTYIRGVWRGMGQQDERKTFKSPWICFYLFSAWHIFLWLGLKPRKGQEFVLFCKTSRPAVDLTQSHPVSYSQNIGVPPAEVKRAVLLFQPVTSI